MTAAAWSLSDCRVVGAMTPLALDAAFSSARAVFARDQAMSVLLIHRSTSDDGLLRGDMLSADEWARLVAAHEALRVTPAPVDRPVVAWVFRAPANDAPWWDEQLVTLGRLGALCHYEDHPDVRALVCLVDPAKIGEVREQWAQEVHHQAWIAARTAIQGNEQAVALRLARRAFCLAPRLRAQDVATLAFAYQIAQRGPEVEAILAMARNTKGEGFLAEVMAREEDLRVEHATYTSEHAARQASASLEGRQIRERVRGKLFARSHERLRYQIRGKLGAGGMGVVYEAFDPILDCSVAIKQLPIHRADDAAFIEQLRHEARNMAKLRGMANVLTLYDFFSETGNVFVVMEYVDGPTLRAWQAQKHGWRETLAMYLQAARGLSQAHDAGLIHRDFKPENVLIAKNGVAKVADFGLAYTPGAGPAIEKAANGETALQAVEQGTARSVAGTLYYMAPEQLANSESSVKSDQYSYCVALYEALFEMHPMLPSGSKASTVPSKATRALNVATDHPLAVAILHGTPQQPVRGGVPRHIIKALRRGMSRNPADRFPSMLALMAALSERPARGIGLLVAAGLTIGVGVWASTRPPPLPPPLPTQEELVSAARSEIKAAVDMEGLQRRVGGDEAATRLIGRLAEKTERWIEIAGRQRFALQQGSNVERGACVELTRERFAGFAKSVSQADSVDLRSVVDQFESLPDPDDCERLPRAYLVCHVDEMKELQHPNAGAIVSEMQTARAHELAGKFVDATAHAAVAASLADVEELPVLQSRAFLLAGRFHQLSEQPAQAMDALQSAYDPIEGQACVGLRADIASHIVKVVAQNPSVSLQMGEAWVHTEMNLAAQIPDDHRRMAMAHSDAGLLLQLRKDDFEGARAESMKAIEIRKAFGENGAPSEIADTYLNLSNAYSSLGMIEGARNALDIARSERSVAYGADHPILYREMISLGILEMNAGDQQAALKAFQRAEELGIRGYGIDSGPAVSSLYNQTHVLYGLERYDEAVAVADRVTAAAVRAKMDPVVRVETQAMAGTILAAAGESSRGIEALQKLAGEIAGQSWAATVFPLVHQNLAEAQAAAEQVMAAEQEVSRVIAWFDTGIPESDEMFVQALAFRANLRATRGAHEEAIFDLTRVLALPRERVEQETFVEIQSLLGLSLQALERPARKRVCEQLLNTTSDVLKLPQADWGLSELRGKCRGLGIKSL